MTISKAHNIIPQKTLNFCIRCIKLNHDAGIEIPTVYGKQLCECGCHGSGCEDVFLT